MDNSVLIDIEKQIQCAQETLLLSSSIKEKIIKLESEKNEALEKCKLLEANLQRLQKEPCANCTLLLKKLNNERLARERLKKEEKTKLLKTIAKTLESMDDGTNAQQLFTQLVFEGLDGTRGPRRIELIKEEDSGDDMYAEETVLAADSEDSNDSKPQLKQPMIVPETELQAAIFKMPVDQLFKSTEKEFNKDCYNPTKRKEYEIEHIEKKLKFTGATSSPSLNSRGPNQEIIKINNLHSETGTLNDKVEKSPSVLSDSPGQSSIGATNEARQVQRTAWKMQPTFGVDSGGRGKRLKQMKLSVGKPNRKCDISTSQGYKGGVTNDLQSDDEKDIVFPSPEHVLRPKKSGHGEIVEDPDITIFQPMVTSTCLPLESSFDKLPEVAKSPPYKYRRDTLRGKEKRMKLPGQDCDECAEYYKAADLDKTQELKLRKNMCSRHRDKYQIRALTPPGFWDPVLPSTPKRSQEIS